MPGGSEDSRIWRSGTAKAFCVPEEGWSQQTFMNVHLHSGKQLGHPYLSSVPAAATVPEHRHKLQQGSGHCILDLTSRRATTMESRKEIFRWEINAECEIHWIFRTSGKIPQPGLNLSWLISQQQPGRQKCSIFIVSVATTERPGKTALSAYSVWQERAVILQESVVPLPPLWTSKENSASPSLVQRIKGHILVVGLACGV